MITNVLPPFFTVHCVLLNTITATVAVFIIIIILQLFIVTIIVNYSYTDPFLFLLLPDLFHQLSLFVIILLQQRNLFNALGTLKIIHLHITRYQYSTVLDMPYLTTTTISYDLINYDKY